jgi:hypothetical protein
MTKRLLNIVLCASLGLASAQSVGQPQLAAGALSQVQPGQWTLKSSEDPSENRSMCVKDARALLQIRHGAAQCSRFVISNESREATVHYTCPGNGHGRTTLRIVTPKVVEIESQGIIDKQPFALMFEGRRVGECATVTGRLAR